MRVRKMTSNKWIKVHTVENIFEMDVLKTALERESIEYMVKGHKDTAYDGLFILQKGYASFFVKEEDQGRAEAVVASIKNMPYVVS
jgi:hypothetical protein